MAKKNSKKLSQESCEKDCKGRMLPDGSYCACIESKLPSLKHTKSVKAYPDEHIERRAYVVTPKTEYADGSISIDELEAKLAGFGLNPHEIELAVARHVYQMTYDEIVKNLGWVDRQTAAYHLRRAMAKIKEGYDQEKTRQ